MTTPTPWSDGIEQLMDIPQLSELFRIPESTFRSWRHYGRGPKSFRLGRRVVYKRSDVEAWLKRQQDETGKGGDQ